MSAQNFVKSLNDVVGKWRRKVERKRQLEPYPPRTALAAERQEYRPPTAETV